jgi:hypothetical protein
LFIQRALRDSGRMNARIRTHPPLLDEQYRIIRRI